MARQIVTQNDLMTMKSSVTKALPNEAVEPKLKEDGYLDRLLKYIPAEIVTVYIFVEGLILQSSNQGELSGIYWIAFIAFCVLTPLYLWKIQKVTKVTQLLIALVAFVVWVFALGGPFVLLAWYKPIYGAVLLPIFTIAIAIVEAEN
jgi:hypothetical protein